MYFPYLINSGAENLSLRTLSDKKKLSNVIPILHTMFIDPDVDWTDPKNVDKFLQRRFKSLLQTFVKNENKLIISLDNSMFERDISVEELYEKFSSYSLDEESLKRTIIFGIDAQDAIEILENDFFYDKNIAIYHRDSVNDMSRYNPIYNILLNDSMTLRFVSSSLSNKVVITDAFQKKDTNRAYGIYDNFSNNAFSYIGNNLHGFGDYTILDKEYKVSSGANSNTITVAVHLTRHHEEEARALRVNHFKCEPEAQEKFKFRIKNVLDQIELNQSIFPNTHGLRTLISISDSTSLAKLKEHSITHHIEFMNSIAQGENSLI